MALRTVYDMKNDSFVVFHADELGEANADAVAKAVAALTALPNVKVENLLKWYQTTYGDRSEEGHFTAFKGYVCKIGALLAAPYDIVALIDLDVVLMGSPFLLLNSDIFQNHGHYLFRDQRSSPSSRTRKYIKELKRLWARFHPDHPRFD
jgi:hypothetical protein